MDLTTAEKAIEITQRYLEKARARRWPETVVIAAAVIVQNLKADLLPAAKNEGLLSERYSRALADIREGDPTLELPPDGSGAFLTDQQRLDILDPWYDKVRQIATEALDPAEQTDAASGCRSRSSTAGWGASSVRSTTMV